MTTTEDEDDGVADPAVGAGTSLREAIAAAALNETSDEITFSDGTGGTIDFTSGSNPIRLRGEHLLIESSLVIRGPEENPIILDGDKRSRLINVDDGDNSTRFEVELENLRMSGGFADSTDFTDAAKRSGGGIRSIENLVMRQCTIEDCRATLSGGGLYSVSAVLEDCQFTGNMAFSGGGAVLLGTSSVVGCVFESNLSEDSSGGGIKFAGGATATMSGCLIRNNSAQGRGGGGGLYIETTKVTIRDSTVVGNSATGSGGAILCNTTSVKVINSTIINNLTQSLGGAFRGSYTGLTVTNCTIVANSGTGACLNLRALSSARFSNSIFADNQFVDFVADESSVENIAFSHCLFDNPADATLAGEDGNVVGDGVAGTLELASIFICDPSGQPLLDSWGGITPTVPLRPGGPAVNRGNLESALDENSLRLELDQRGVGYPRVSGATIDLGAFEVQKPQALVLQLIETAPNGTRLEATAPIGAVVGVAFSPDLSPGSWFELGNFFKLPGTNGLTFFDPDSARAQRGNGYYRAFLRNLSN